MARVVVNMPELMRHLRSEAPQAALDEVADALVESIKDESPVNTGAYQDSIRSRRYPTRRRVYSVDWWAHLIEWGGANVPGPGGGPAIVYAPFRRGARNLDLPFVEAQKGEPE